MTDHHKTFVGELIHGEFKPAWQDFKEFLGADETVAQALEKGWHGLPIELQNALVYGTGILNEIVADFDKIPPEIIKVIQDKFPNVDLDKVKEILQKILVGFTNVEGIGNLTLEETIQALLPCDELLAITNSMSLPGVRFSNNAVNANSQKFSGIIKIFSNQKS